MLHISLSILFTLILLSGCLPPPGTRQFTFEERVPVVCSDILDPEIFAFSWESMTKDDLDTWVSTNYPDAVIRDRQITQDYVQIGWTIGNENYSVHFKDRVRRFYLSLTSEPALADLLRCYGEPAYYAMEYVPAPEAAAIRFEIWYPKLGLWFISEEYSSWPFRIKTTFDEHTRFHSGFMVPPGTMEEMLASWTEHDAVVARILAMIQPWPEEFEVIEYTGEFRWGR
jgi:hypothetical protein